MSKQYYTHDETLEIIENLMKESGLRKFCSEYCKGSCCSGCYETDDACHKNEGRRISCSIYVCYRLKRLIGNKNFSILCKVGNYISHTCRNGQYYGNINSLEGSSVYFNKPKDFEFMRKNIKFDKEKIDELKNISTSYIFNRVMMCIEYIDYIIFRGIYYVK